MQYRYGFSLIFFFVFHHICGDSVYISISEVDRNINSIGYFMSWWSWFFFYFPTLVYWNVWVMLRILLTSCNLINNTFPVSGSSLIWVRHDYLDMLWDECGIEVGCSRFCYATVLSICCHECLHFGHKCWCIGISLVYLSSTSVVCCASSAFMHCILPLDLGRILVRIPRKHPFSVVLTWVYWLPSLLPRFLKTVSLPFTHTIICSTSF